MFIKYWENRKIPVLKESDTDNPIDLIRQSGIKIKNEIYRKLGVELVFYNVDDAMNSIQKLKSSKGNYKTNIRDNSIFIYY